MRKFQITFKGQVYELDVEEISSAGPGIKKTVSAPTVPQTPVLVSPEVHKTVIAPIGAHTVVAPMPGKILEVNVKIGDLIKRGDVVCILEAMKMQNEIMATHDGTISDVRVTLGQIMSTGDVIIVTG